LEDLQQLKPSGQLSLNSNYRLSGEGVVPMWERPCQSRREVCLDHAQKKELKIVKVSANGGCFTVLAIVGGDMDGDEVCGAVVSIRKNPRSVPSGSR
jgi:hypothetical protein